MALSLKDLRRSGDMPPPRILIYGPPGLGKTTLASEWPAPILLDIEHGRPADIDRAAVPGFDEELVSFDAVMEAIGALYTDDHGFLTLILDTLDRLESMVWAKVCQDNNWPSIEAPGYGKGYVEADRVWRDLLDGLNALRRDRGMTIILIAHSAVTQFDDPQAASYSRYDIKLHKRALGLIQGEVDAILFVNQDATIKQNDPSGKAKQGPGARVRAEGGGNRWVYCEGRPAFTAKNRYGLPDRFMYRKGEGYGALAEFLSGPAPAEEPKPAGRRQQQKEAA